MSSEVAADASTGTASGGAGPAGLPWRGPGPNPPDLPLPPEGRQPVFGPRRRMLKRWRYVGVFCDEFMLCAARAKVGPFGQTFWAIVDRERGEMVERTRKLAPFARGEVWSVTAEGSAWPIGSEEPGVVTWIDSKDARAKLKVGDGKWAVSVCPNGEGGWIWTRKRIAPVTCDVRLPGGRRWKTIAFGIEDESLGYHPRRTVWSWSAGVGTAADGRAVGWNLVSGVNDPERNSERAVWLDGEPFEPGPVSFDPDLGWVDFAEGGRLSFEGEAERRSRENLGLVKFDYRQPFGSFTGSVAGTELASGLGVMEFHDALW